MKKGSNKGTPSLFSPELIQVTQRLKRKEPEVEEIIEPKEEREIDGEEISHPDEI